MKKYDSPSLELTYGIVDVLTSSRDEYEGEIDYGAGGQSTGANYAW